MLQKYNYDLVTMSYNCFLITDPCYLFFLCRPIINISKFCIKIESILAINKLCNNTIHFGKSRKTILFHFLHDISTDTISGITPQLY